jgi:acetyl-CoA carboxylase biotin carboxyl carrier protein
MNFDNLEYFKKLAKLLNENSLSEITVTEGEKSVTVKREVMQAQQVISAAPQISVPKEEKVQSVEIPSRRTAIVSPMVGSFYASPAPGEKPFVKVGDNVAAGQVVCIVEAMKLMNEIEAEVSGKIIEICVEDGQSVEYGQVLMYVE